MSQQTCLCRSVEGGEGKAGDEEERARDEEEDMVVVSGVSGEGREGEAGYTSCLIHHIC